MRIYEAEVGFFLSVLLLACSSDKHTDNYNIFKYNESRDSSLDPAFAKDQASIWAINNYLMV